MIFHPARRPVKNRDRRVGRIRGEQFGLHFVRQHRAEKDAQRRTVSRPVQARDSRWGIFVLPAARVRMTVCTISGSVNSLSSAAAAA